MVRIAVLVASALLEVLGTGCTSQPTAKSVIEVGIASFSGDQARNIAVPSSATIGAPVAVTISTEGDGCFSVDSTDVSPTSQGFLVTPYDRDLIPPPGQGCTLELDYLPHQATVTFPTAGSMTITLHVRKPQGAQYQEVDLPFAVTVR